MKQITWQKNFINKTAAEFFMHLDLAPKNGVPISKLPAKVQINFEDGTPSKQCFLLFFTRFKMQNVNDTVSLVSHGMLAKDYFEKMFAADKRLNWQTEMALYIYADEKQKSSVVPFLLSLLEKKNEN